MNTNHREVELSNPEMIGTYRKIDGGCLPIELIDVNFQIFMIAQYIF